MEYNRVVDITVTASRAYGSGYLVTNRLILTAKHVVEAAPPNARCTVSPVHIGGTPTGQAFEASVLWVSTEYDAALLQTDSPIPGLKADSIVFGRVPLRAVSRPCRAMGFPDSQGNADYNDDRQLIGRLTWVSRDKRFDIDVENATPQRANNWRGFSGAAVFGKYCLGIVRGFDERFDGKLLEATPIELLFADERFCKLVAPIGQASDLLVPEDEEEGGAPAQASQARSKRFAQLLPYLCDRRMQRRRFREAVEAELERDLVRPQMFFVVGEDSQCADKFAEQLFFVDLPNLLQRNGLSGSVEGGLLRWPADIGPRADADEIKDHLSELERELQDKLWEKTRSGIERRLERQNGALFVYFDISIRKWSDGHRRLLGEWIGWWSRLNTAKRRYPIIVVGRFCYTGTRILPFWGRSPTVRVLDDLTGLSKSAGDRMKTAILPQLGHVSYEDIDAWIDENADLAAEAPPDLHQRLRKFFAGVLGMGEREVPMSQAASLLRKIMDEMKISADAPASRSPAS